MPNLVFLGSTACYSQYNQILYFISIRDKLYSASQYHAKYRQNHEY